MTLPEFKQASEDYQKLIANVPGIKMAILADKVVEAAYLAGLEHGIKRGVMAGKK